MSDPLSPAARVARRIRLFRVAAGILVILVGVVAAIVGATLTASQTWPSATGTVQSCTTVSNRTGTSGTRTYRQRCEVSWMDGEHTRTAQLDLDGDQYVPGAPVRVRYNGGTTVVETPAWIGLATGGVGLVLLAAGAYVLLRATRRAR
ncbi:DUF3592 domain-containing protein [Phytohabitans flavus]|nr:DUF3592 domain-containing protein [Phytohabitans flavus]